MRAAFLIGVAIIILSGGAQDTVGVPIRTQGLQTNTQELDRFIARAESEPYQTDLNALVGHAETARDSWPHTITAGAWEDDGSDCEPVGETTTDGTLRLAATDTLALALAGYLEGLDSFNAAARTHILEFAATEDFEIALLSGANECIIDLGSAAFHIFEAAWLLEEGGYASWTDADKLAVATWAAEEVFPILSWGIDSRKSNWGIVTFGSALSAAAFAEGAFPSLTKHDASTVTPAAYLSAAGTPLEKWLSASGGDELDSECEDGGYDFGLQVAGNFPDDTRRPSATGTADCEITSIGSHSSDGACSTAATCGETGGHFYHQKSTNALARVCEILRRYDDYDGSRCFDLADHGGDDTALIDAAQFATNGDYQTGYIQDNTQGFRYVAGEYYANADLLAARDDGSVSVRGGRDYAYTKITHAPGVAYGVDYSWSLGDLSSYSTRLDVDWDHSQWANEYDTEAELNALGWSTVTMDPASPPSGSAGSCSAGGADSSEDSTVINAYFTANCTAPSGSTPGVCNNVFEIPESCVLDYMAPEPGDIDDPTLFLNYSNFAIVGANKTTSEIRFNNVPESTSTKIGAGIATSNSWGFGGSSGSTYTVSTSDSSDDWTIGDGYIRVSTCSGLSDSDLIRITGADEDSEVMYYDTRVLSHGSGGDACKFAIADPFPTTFTTRTSIQEIGIDRRQYNIFLNFKIEYPNILSGQCTPNGPADIICADPFRIHGSSNVLFQGVTIGRHGNQPIQQRNNYQVVVRHSTLGPGMFAQTRGNNTEAVSRLAGGSMFSTYNNIHKSGAMRLALTASGATFGYHGFNFWEAQPSSGERCVFVNHDSESGYVGRFLVENNNFRCIIEDHMNGNPTSRYATFFRNQSTSGINVDNTFSAPSTLETFYYNWIANLTSGGWTYRSGYMDNALGLYNVSRSSIPAPAGSTGVEWPTSGTGRNIVVGSGPHTDAASITLPPSLGLRNDLPPSWWCEESGPWSDEWLYGSLNGLGGTTIKTPAEIRSEGGDCTTPALTADYGVP